MDIVLACYLNPSGLSRAAREYYRLLVDEGFRVIPVWLMEPTPEGVDKGLAGRMLSASGRPVGESPLEIHVGLPHAIRTYKGASAVLGSCVFENHLLNREQVAACQQMTGVLAPSHFCLNACLSSGVPNGKVSYVPYPLDSRTWNAGVEPSEPRSGKFRFLYLNSWYERKGYDVMLAAWWRAFGKGDSVELWVKSYREDDRPRPIASHIDDEARRLGVDRDGEADIRVFDEVMGDNDIPAFMRSCDCYVSPHRSEGFGMNVWYAMALGIPVVCTDYGGTRDFAKDDTAWLVSAPSMSSPGPAETAVFPHLGGTRWAEPSVDSLVERMVQVATSPADAEERARNAYGYVHGMYAPRRALGMLRGAVEKAAPGAWSQLGWAKALEALEAQESPRFESADRPVRLVEI